MFNKIRYSFSFKLLFLGFLLYLPTYLLSCTDNKKITDLSTSKTVHNADNLQKHIIWPHDNSDLKADNNIIYGKLDNGFRYALMENNMPKNRVSMHLLVNAGSVNEDENEQGVAHFLEHMLFNGSDNFKPGELVKHFQKIGMQFGHDANAHTGFNETVYDVFLSNGSKKSLEDGLIILKDFADGAHLLPSEIEKEKKVVLAEKQSRDSASYRTYISTLKFELPETKIPERLPIGKEKIIIHADQLLLKTFYNTWYRPKNMVLIVVGDFDTKQIISLIKDKFDSIKAKIPAKKNPDFGNINHKGVKAFYHYEKEEKNTSVTIEVLTKIKQEPDLLANRKQNILNDIASQIVENRLYSIIRKPKSFCTSAFIESGTFLRHVKYATISADGNPENWNKNLHLLEQTLRRAIKFGFTSQEIERVKKDFITNFDNAAVKASTRESKRIAHDIIRSVSQEKVFLSPKQEKKIFVPFIKSLTTKKIHSAFKKMWKPDHRLVLVTGNAFLLPANSNPSIKPEDKILSELKNSQKINVTKPDIKKAVSFPYLSAPENTAIIKQRTDIKDLDIVQIEFKNGVSLNLKKTDFKTDEILVNVAFGSGKFSEPADKQGLSELTMAVVNESGLSSLTKDELERAMAGKYSSFMLNVHENYFSLKGNTISKELVLLFQVIYSYILDQGYKENAFYLSMERFNQLYLSLNKTINGAMELSGKNFLAGGDSRFGLPPFDIFKKLTIDDVKTWIDKPLKQEPLEVSVVGDFDENKVINLVSRYLGSLPVRKNSKTAKRSGSIHFPVNQFKKIKILTAIPKGLVTVVYKTEDIWNIKTTRRLNILADIFSDRLRVKIREKLGAAYSPFAFNKPFKAYPGYGMFNAYIETDPKQAYLVADEVKKIALDLSLNGVNHDELLRAVKPAISSIKDMKRTNRYWLNTVLTGSTRHPEKIQWSRSIEIDYANITEKELSLLAKKYLINQKAATIIITSEKTK